MKKVFIFVAALIICTSFSFASDLESESFDAYSFDPLTTSVLEYAVMPLADASWTTSDSQNLENILEAITPSSLVSNPSLYTLVRYLRQNSDSILTALVGGNGSISSPSSNSIVGLMQYLPNLVSLQSMEYNIDYIEESTSGIKDDTSSMLPAINSMKSILDYNFGFATWPAFVNGSYISEATTFRNIFGNTLLSLNYDTQIFDERSLYGRIKQLQEVLASDDDLALAESQKQNREEIEDSFLNGSSGSTSLGASDFGDLSDVGGTVKDSISLNGQASVSSFTSGLAGADESGQGWFSAATRDSLDSVSGSVSTFALDDPYNMSGWYDRYSWVEGD